MELRDCVDWQEQQLHHRRLHRVLRPVVRRSADHLGAAVALLTRLEKERFPTKPLAFISLLFMGSGALSLAIYAVVVELDEPLETAIGLLTLIAFGIPAAFILASAAWLLFTRRHASA